MEQIVSLVVANGLFAVLFCGLLVYELRDSRNRERKYTQTIRALTDRLDAVKTVKTDVNRLADDLSELRSDVGEIKSATVPRRGKTKRAGGCECATTSA